MRKTIGIPATLFALFGVSTVGDASWQASAPLWANEDGNASSSGSGGSDDPTDHGSNGNVLAGQDDPVQKEDMSRPHVSTRYAEEEADGLGE